MKQIRQGTFETNSSSTHSLVVLAQEQENYIPLSKYIKIEWIDTNDYYMLETLQEKLSYLVSHIANKLKYSCNNYKELLEEIEDNFEYKKIKDFIKTKFNKEIRFPEDKTGIYDEDIECICEINHQLIPWSTAIVVEEVLNELIQYMKDKNRLNKYSEEQVGEMSFDQKLDIYLKSDNYLLFGRD